MNYTVESKLLFCFKWEHRREFTSEAQALAYLEYLQQKPKVTVIKW